MSRTRHATPTSCFRHMKVQNYRKTECTVLDQLKEESVLFRHINRISSYWSLIPNPWDDYRHSAFSEYQNKGWPPNKAHLKTPFHLFKKNQNQQKYQFINLQVV